MKLPSQHRRLKALVFGLALGFCALACRLVEYQAVRHDELQALASANTVRAFPRLPLRGQILDIRGNPLATSAPAKMICADPSLLLGKAPLVARALAPILQTNEAWLLERLTPRVTVADGKTNLSKFVVLQHQAPVETWEKVRNTMASLPLGVNEAKLNATNRAAFRALHEKALFASEEQRRVYPGGSLAAHVVGYVSGEGAEQTGMDGIEHVFNAKLGGVPGWCRTEMDKRGRELVPYRDENIEPIDGLNVVLTLDAGLQNIMESEVADAFHKLGPVSISAVMMRPKTGEILALVNVPNFDPNHPGASAPDALRDRLIADCHEPGSTFKIVVVSGALDENTVTLDQVFNCEESHFVYAGATLHDSEPHGDLTVEGIITHSSNIGAAKIGIALGQETLFRYIQDFGFGARTGILLPGEAYGIVHPVSSWSKISIARIPMGQGIAVTPLQTVMAMAAIANQGLLMRPMLVDSLVDASGKVVVKYNPQPVRRVASAAAMTRMVTALKTVPTVDGTAPAARLERYTVAGKTGTAEKVENGHYVSDKYFCSFIGFFPADNPELCIGVFIDEPPKRDHFGGAAAGPVFKAIASRAADYLNLKPDIQPGNPANPALTIAAAPQPGAHSLKNN